MFPRALKNGLIRLGLTPDESSRIDRAPKRLNSAGIDDWGLDPETVKAALASLKWLYKDYFRVKTHGLERLPTGRVLLVANHGGQLPLDGLLISIAVALEGNPPRITRGMVERFFPTLPFVSTLFTRCGQVVGDHRNCRDLLENEECVLVFPEGTRGSGKRIFERYELQAFGTGFARLALETKTPVVPVAVIGCEETYPGLTGLKPLAKKLGLPYLPVTPFFPLLGILGALPLPTKVTLRFGEPIVLQGDPDGPDSEIETQVQMVQSALKLELETGLKKRGSHIFSGAGA